jgi:oligoendopeptidase F
LSPLDTIKLLGVDLNKPKVYQDAKNILNGWIKKLSTYS